MATHYYTVSWDQFHRDSRALSWKLLGRGPDSGRWRGIVAVSRGGLVPAAILARELDCRVVESVSVAVYEEERRGQPVVLKPPLVADGGDGFLVVDDLVDTGVTFGVIRRLLPSALYVCVYAKPAGYGAVDVFVTEVSQDTWILFPWDTEPRFVAPQAWPSAS
jgi:xanthine phosphoribosyltransferase